MLAVPLYVLFELGLLLMKVVPKEGGEGPMGEGYNMMGCEIDIWERFQFWLGHFSWV